MDPALMTRNLILSVFMNRAVAGVAQRYGLRLGASRFIAGTTLAEAMAVVQALNARGILATLDHLGESVFQPAEATAAAAAYHELLAAIDRVGVTANVSVKLTAMGLAFDADLARRNVEGIVRLARQYGNFVRIDMEDTPYTDRTLAIYRALRQQGLDNVGVVIQSYLYRSDRDLDELAALGANVRLVKGAYREPPHLAYPRKADVDAAFRRHIRLRLASGLYTAVATHDEAAIAYTQQVVQELGIPRDRFEFQMLYGIRSQRQEELARAGYRVRCYVPYGTHWYPYFVRRLAERPANLGFVLRNLIRG